MSINPLDQSINSNAPALPTQQTVPAQATGQQAGTVTSAVYTPSGTIAATVTETPQQVAITAVERSATILVPLVAVALLTLMGYFAVEGVSYDNSKAWSALAAMALFLAGWFAPSPVSKP